MRLSPFGWIGLAALFVLVLLYATVVSMPEPPPSAEEHDALRAEQACADAVRERVEGARFPFAANAAYLGEARYRLSGVVDAPRGGELVRRNYECVVRYAPPGAYLTDSLRVWQSH